MAVGATAVNRFYVSITGDGRARMAFGEVLDEELFYRVAVSMAEDDAIALRDFLNQLYPVTKN